MMAKRIGAFALALTAAACLRAAVDEPDVWPCETNADCLDGNRCLVAASGHGECHPPDFCFSTADCGSGLVGCVNNTCRQFECGLFDASACGDYGCNTTTSTCYTSCVGAEYCAPGYVCLESECVPPPCTADTAEVCGDYACLDGLCLTSCVGSSDCAPYLTCDAGVCKAVPLTDGSACPLDDACVSKSCQNGVCAPCADSTCTAAICADVECGSFAGVDCGGCDGANYCELNQCIPACDVGMCGVHNGVDCGGCQELNYCDPSGSCQPACADRECGTNLGVDCGSCADGKACNDEGLCVDAICPEDQTHYCKDQHVYMCFDGFDTALVDACYGDDYCEEGVPTCHTYLCPGTTCYDFHEVTGGNCTDVLTSSSAALGNIYAVNEAARLVNFTQTVDMSGFGPRRWFVYDSTSANGPFTEIASVTVFSYDPGGPQTSPTFEIDLEVDHWYILGVEAASPDVTYTFCYSAFEPEDGLPFGMRSGSYYSADGLPAGSIVDPTGPGPTLQEVYVTEIGF